VGLKDGVDEAVGVTVGVGLGGMINWALTATPWATIEKSVFHRTCANGPVVSIVPEGKLDPLPLNNSVDALVRPS
jgi:hypothetical protein